MQLPVKYKTEDLIAGLKEKNLIFFSSLYDTYAPALYGVIWRDVEEKETAEQILEETFIAMWNNPVIDSRYENHFLLWMISVAKSITRETLSNNLIMTKTIPQEQYMKRILLVEDDENCIQLVKHILNAYGFVVETNNTGLDISKVVYNFNPDLILLDISLPGRSGMEICKELKQTTSIPVILFSSQAQPEKLVKDCNADSFLGKPFDIKEMISTVGLLAN